MAVFGGSGLVGQTNRFLGGPFSEPGRMDDVWSQILQSAQQRWGGATSAEVGRLGGQQQAAMGMFNPYAEQFQNLASPYGQSAISAALGYQNLMSDPSQITSDPLYTARLGAGQQAIENSAAARGMQLSGTNLLDQGQFASNLAADTMNQRLGQYAQQSQMGLAGLGAGLQGLGGISQINMGYDQMLNQALYGGLGQQTDIMGAEAQANAAAELGYLNALTENRGAHLGAIGSIVGGVMGGM